MTRIALFLAPLLAAMLSACGGGDTSAVAAAPTRSAKPAAAPAGTSWTETVAATDEGYRLGNPAASVKLVEYGARLCPACKALADEAYAPLIANYVATGKVSFEFRDFLIHGPGELGLAVLARCVDKSAFFPILEQNYANQDAMNQKLYALTPAQQQALQGAGTPVQVVTRWTETIGGLDFMKQRGLSEAKARACLADEKTIDAITAVTQKAGSNGTVTGTPTLIVNGNKVDGISWAVLEKALKAAGA